MTELKDILRTKKNYEIENRTVCLIVYEEQGKTYIGKCPLYDNKFWTNGVKALLTEDEVLDLVDQVGDYFNNLNLTYEEPIGTLVLTESNPKQPFDKFSIRGYVFHPSMTYGNGYEIWHTKPTLRFTKKGKGTVKRLSLRYEKYAVITPEMIIRYIEWNNTVRCSLSSFIRNGV